MKPAGPGVRCYLPRLAARSRCEGVQRPGCSPPAAPPAALACCSVQSIWAPGGKRDVDEAKAR